MHHLRALLGLIVIWVLLAPAPVAASPAQGTYVVRPGDTLAKIAAAHGTTVQALIRANNITDPDLIRSGQVLVIPDKATSNSGAQTGATAPPPVPAPAGGTGFVVSVSRQRCYLFQAGTLTDVWPCSPARAGYYPRLGNFKVQSKLPRAYGSRWGFWMPYWLGIYYAGGSENGIHGLPYDAKTGYKDWANKIGTPISFGCIVLHDAAAKKLYDIAYIGMPENIRY
ncbi:MAG: LysM peptidoglycan-binding domain-containing protein, partial [Anaerolineae bacterium]|nr:LysM peptidoglycan-binding domain-containing protein [Anaerolineae bacterium]